MNTAQTLKAFVKLGGHLDAELQDTSSQLQKLIREAKQYNGWFTEENVATSVRAITPNLNTEKLTDWLSNYQIPSTKSPFKIGVIMAGNIPLVGFHDFMCVLFSENIFIGKTSSQDSHLLPYIADQLIKIEPAFKERIFFADKLNDIDAVIATGSDNSARYFDYYFGKYPHIIRKNRNSIAILDGTETAEQVELLGKDIFQYFGLGCRNVSKIFIPEDYKVDSFFKPIESYSDIIHHHKYANNYNYNRTIYLMNKNKFYDNGFLVLKGDAALASPVGVLFFEYYNDLKSLEKKLAADKNKIQCIVGKIKSEQLNIIPFGKAQSPDLSDYADEVDTMKFLLGL